jgi:hypothetical protein
MVKKYKLTTKEKKIGNTVLYQIKALKDELGYHLNLDESYSGILAFDEIEQIYEFMKSDKLMFVNSENAVAEGEAP